MRRTLFTLTSVLALAAWASAQTAPPRLAGDQVRLLQTNCQLLEELVDDGLKLSRANGKLSQAEGCRQALSTLGRALTAAGGDPAADPDRLAELTDQMSDLVRDGLAPTMAEARAQVRAGSPGAERLAELERATRGELVNAQNALPVAGRAGQSPLVQASQQKFAELVRSLDAAAK